MNNAANVKETVTHNGANSRRESSPDGEAVAKNPLPVMLGRRPAAESVTFIWDDIQ